MFSITTYLVIRFVCYKTYKLWSQNISVEYFKRIFETPNISNKTCTVQNAHENKSYHTYILIMRNEWKYWAIFDNRLSFIVKQYCCQMSALEHTINVFRSFSISTIETRVHWNSYTQQLADKYEQTILGKTSIMFSTHRFPIYRPISVCCLYTIQTISVGVTRK